MKSLSSLLLWITLLPFSSIAQQVDTLTNEKVIKLFKAGFGKDVLNSKIQNSTSKFDVSIDGMVSLKKSGIPEETINLMISNPEGSATGKSTNSFQSNREASRINLASGIYYKNTASEYLEIEPSVLTSTKTNNAAQLFVSGLINAKVKAALSGKQSSFEISESSPTFIFVFDTTNKGSLNSDNNAFFSNARSPKEFLLVKLNVERNSREITVGKTSAVSSNMGIDDKSVTLFTVKKLSTGVYEVTPQSGLLEGEYCFMFAQGIKQGQSNKVFDFSIKSKKGF